MNWQARFRPAQESALQLVQSHQSHADWRTDERALLQAFLQHLTRRDARWELQFGSADDGAPWACLQRDTPLAGGSYHFARIGQAVIVARPERGFSIRTTSLRAGLDALGVSIIQTRDQNPDISEERTDSCLPTPTP
jgi:hypothetical protein